MKKWLEKVYRYVKRKGWISYDKVYRHMAELHVGNRQEIEARVDHYYIENGKKTIVIAMISVLAGGVVCLADTVNEKNGIWVMRNDYGEEESTCTLIYQDKNHGWQELSLTVEAVQYREEELVTEFQEGFLYLEETFLGDNPSMEEIRTDLELITSIPDSGITVQWSSSDYELLDVKGVVHNESIQQVQTVELMAQLEYGEVQQSKEYVLTIYPRQVTESEAEGQAVLSEIMQIAQAHPYEKKFQIPSEIQGVPIRTQASPISRGVVVIIVGIGVSGLLWLRQKEDMKKQMRQRKEELQREYSGMVNQLLLYMGAGATIKGAFERILQQYEKQSKTQGALYQELLIMWNEMRAGVSQGQAYLNMGKRTGLLSYMRFTNLLAQQVQKGDPRLALQLEQEEHAAFERRKEQAKKYGEEAGTKLLIPMIMLMVISMILVVGPAILNFTV